MKQIRTLAVCMLVLVFLAGMAVVGAEITSKDYCPDGYASVMGYGAKGDGKTDDTVAFQQAVSSGSAIFVPAGEFLISDTINLESTLMVGVGIGKSVITFTGDNPHKAIIRAGSYSSIRDMTIGFAEGLVTGEEKIGERTAILAGGAWSLQRGASIRRVELKNVGTGIYSSESLTDPINEENGATGDGSCPFSVTFEDVSVRDFSFRGMDIHAMVRTGNIYRNLYFTSKYTANSALYFDHEESENVIDGIVVDGVKATYPVYLCDLRAAKIGSIAIYNTESTLRGSGLITFSGMNGSVDSLIIGNCRARDVLINMERGYYWESGDIRGSEGSFLKIDTLLLDNVSEASLADQTFSFFARTGPSIYRDEGTYTVEIDRYVYHTANDDDAVYAELKTSGERMTVTVKGASRR